MPLPSPYEDLCLPPPKAVSRPGDTGIDGGKTVVPDIRFPGETTFTAGSARPEITDGEFVWQRMTGKRVTVVATNDDGDIQPHHHPDVLGRQR